MAPTHLTIDLAERHSGCILMDETHDVLWEGNVDVGPRNKEQPHVHVEALRRYWLETLWQQAGRSDKVWIEDIPPHLINPKPVVRLQGLLLDKLSYCNIPYELVNATVWQKDLGYKKIPGRTSKGWAKATCTQLGYAPETAGKQTVDLRDAYLFNVWTHGWRPGA